MGHIHPHTSLAMSYPGQFSSSSKAGQDSYGSRLGLEKISVSPARRKVSCVGPMHGVSRAITPYHVKTFVLSFLSFLKSSFADLPEFVISTLPDPPSLFLGEGWLEDGGEKDFH